MSVDVLFLSRFNAFCGVSTYTEQLATALANKRVDVGALSSDFKSRGCETDVPCIVGWSEDGELGEALDKIIEINPKIVHIQHEHGIFRSTESLLKLCRAIKKRTDSSVVMTAHTVPIQAPRPGHDFERLVGSVDAIVVHSEIGAKVVSEYSSLPKSSRVEFIPHGMLGPVGRIPRDVACKEVGLDPAEHIFRLLSFGFIAGAKRHMAMIQVVGAIVSRQMMAPRKLELVIAGRPMDDAKGILSMMKKSVSSMNIEHNVRFDAEFVPFERLPYYYGASDMAIHMVDPLNHSASGSMRTDLSHGLPIIATRSGMTMDLDGGVYKVGGTDEMMTSLCRIAKSNDILSVLRQQAVEFTRRNRWSVVAQRHIMLYERLSGVSLMDKREGIRSALFHSSPWLLGGAP